MKRSLLEWEKFQRCRKKMQEFDSSWQKLSEEVLTGMKEWREQHPKATLSEIEEALDERLGRLRTQMLQDVALASDKSDWSPARAQDRPRCPLCGTPLVARGKKTRHIQTNGGADLALTRSYGVCPRCESGLFPPR